MMDFNLQQQQQSYPINDYIELQAIYDPFSYPVSATSFDSQQELLWIGNNEVTSKFLKSKFFGFFKLKSQY